MAEKSGANSSAGLTVNSAATAWGTAGSLSTGDSCQAAYTPSQSVSELTSSPIGTGNQMDVDSQAGAVEYGFSLSGEATYQSGLDRVMAPFFGTSGTPSEQNVGEGDYLHTMTFNSTWNSNYNTYGIESSTTTTHEYASAACTSLSLSSSSVKSYLTWNASFVADDIILTSPTNNNAALQATTIADDEKIVVSSTDEFWLNAQAGGALSSSDRVAITDYTLTLNKPQETAKEVKGAAGNGEPVQTGLLEGTLSITLRKSEDNTYYTAWDAGTEYKCLFQSIGTQIASGDNKSITLYVPRMKLINAPDFNNADVGINPLQLTFKILAASSNPTGMSSTLPYAGLLNERSTAYLS